MYFVPFRIAALALVSFTLLGTTSPLQGEQPPLAFAPSPPTNIKVLVGTTLTISGVATGTTPIAYQWRFNGTNIANATSTTFALQNIATNQAGNYTLVISNAAGVLTSAPPSVVTVLPYGAVDTSWTNLLSSYPWGAQGLARAPDGSYYVATGLNAVHVNADGSFDTSGFIDFISYFYRWNDQSLVDINFGPNLIQREADGKILVAGSFKVFYPTPVTVVTNVNRIARLNANGTLDGTFKVGSGATNTIDAKFETSILSVNSVIRLTNGQYLVAGSFNRFNGLARTNLVRLNNDGSLDLSFPAHSSRYTSAGDYIGSVYTMALQADGKILVGGAFEVFDGVTNRNLTRLNADGTPDGTFAQTTLPAPSAGEVRTVLPLPDGKIFIGGQWFGQTNIGVLRFETNGVRDAT